MADTGHRIAGKCPFWGTWGGYKHSPCLAKAVLPAPFPCPHRLPARCTLRFLAFPSPAPGTSTGRSKQPSTAWHSAARRTRREWLANKPVQGGGRREARVIPLPKMLLLLTDRVAESQELRHSPAPGAPPAPWHGQPNTAALPGAHGLTHSPRDDGHVLGCHRGQLPGGAVGFRAPNRWAQAFAGRRKPHTVPDPSSITYLWLQRLCFPHPTPMSGGRRPGLCRCPSPGSPRRWLLGAGAHRPQACWQLSQRTKRMPGREAGQKLSTFPFPSPSRASPALGGTPGGAGAHRHRMLLFSCRPVHVAGAGSCTPAHAAGLQLDPADGSRHSQTRKAGAGGERT